MLNSCCLKCQHCWQQFKPLSSQQPKLTYNQQHPYEDNTKHQDHAITVARCSSVPQPTYVPEVESSYRVKKLAQPDPGDSHSVSSIGMTGCSTRRFTATPTQNNSSCLLVKLGISENSPIHNLQWIVDTVARFTIIDLLTCKHLLQEEFPLIKNGNTVSTVSADGSPIEVLGKLLLPIWFSTYKLYVTVFMIQGTTRTELLGLDILQQFSVWSVDIRHSQLKLDSTELPLQVVTSNLPTVRRVFLQADVVISPEGFAWVNAKLPERYLPSEAVFHSEPHLSTCKKVLSANGLVQNNVLSNAVKVKIMNPEDKPHKLYHWY